MNKEHTNNELRFMIDLCTYLSKDYAEQYNSAEWFWRWNLPDEIALEWIDAEGIINSDELSAMISPKALAILKKILNNMEYVLESPQYNEICTQEALEKDTFWERQRELAKKFLELSKGVY